MMLVFFRLLQGAAGGGLQPTQQAIILDSFPPSKRGQVFAITGITMIVAPILGPTLGGLITDNFNWRWIFYINIPIGILAFLLVARMVEDPEHAKAHHTGRVDYLGLGLIGLGLGALQIMLDKGQQDDWFDSHFIIAMGVMAVTCITGAVLWLLRQENPMVDLRLLKDRAFAMSCILIFITGFVLYGGSTLLPLMLQSLFGYDATLAGMVLSPSGFAIMFLMPVSAKLISRVQAKWLVAVGMLLCAFGMIHSTMITPQTDYNTFLWIRLSQVIGLPFLFVPISTLAFAHIPPAKSSKASALFALSRNMGGSVGIAIAIAHLARATQQHHQVLVGHLVPSSPIYQQAVGHAQQALGPQFGLSHIYQQLQMQSSILGYIDAYNAMAMLMVGGAIAAMLLLPKNNPREKPSPEAAAVH
jgi:DHA2 family multidrug resistance protein